MRKTKSIIAVCLVSALAFSGMASAPQLKAAQGQQTFALAADAASGSSATVSGPAATLTGDAAALKKDIDAFNSLSGTVTESKKRVRVQRSVLGDTRTQLEYYAAHVLYEKNDKITKFATVDLETLNPEELLIMAGKKLSIYNYEYGMMAPDYSAKPVATIKNVVEVRVKNANKGLFTVKTKKGKTVSYVSYKYTYDGAKKQGTYSVNGNVYKKGSKKISQKAFKKYLKSYKKQTLVEMEDLFYAAYSDGYTWGGYLYLAKDFYLLDTDFLLDTEGNSILGTLVMKHEADENVPYKAFVQTETSDNFEKYRVVFGDDEKDWKGLRDKMTDLTYFIKPLREAMEDTTMTVMKNEYLSTKDNTVYSLSFKPIDGAEADYGYLVSVDESGDIPKFNSVELVTSINVTEEKWEFLYDENAEVDGEMYEPGSDSEIYADPDYVKNLGCKVRSLKVDVNGTTKEFQTLDYIGFYLYSSSGKFSGTVDGKLINPIKMNATSPDLSAVMSALNPRNVKDGGYYDPKITDLKWTPNA
ncbi:MAG: hypothetical protein J5819_08385 [Eubacterium sp.]|nr:hypothetical protein [Eubacterium sp.]